MNTYIKKKKLPLFLNWFCHISWVPVINLPLILSLVWKNCPGISCMSSLICFMSLGHQIWLQNIIWWFLLYRIRLLKDVNENSEERESLVWFGLGLCGLSRWVNFRVRWVDVFLVLFQVGLKIVLGFGCLVLSFWIWVGWFSWFNPKLMGLCLLIGLSFEFIWSCMGLWELSLIDEGVDCWG